MMVFACAGCSQLLSKLKPMSLLFFLSAALTMTVSAQTFTTLANLSVFNDDPRYMPFVQGHDGDLYGTSEHGGPYGNGTVFEITPGGTLTTLYSFCGAFSCSDGAYPCGGLVESTDGNFYGATEFGGTQAEGTIFKMSPEGAVTTIYSFCSQSGCADGINPCGTLVHATDGNFYGTTIGGGNDSEPCDNGCGTVFTITPAGALTTLYRFCSTPDCADGVSPNGLIQATDGNFYGTTFTGGTQCEPGCGTIFSITPGGALTTLHSFEGGDGFIVTAGLTQASDGNFYGTAALGGTYDDGTIFKITPAGVFTVLQNFDGTNGSEPFAGLIQATDGNFYGTTAEGGDNCSYQIGGCGTIFVITPNGALRTLYRFPGSGGYNPDNPLFQATDGKFYGTTIYGGANGYGTVFDLSAGLNPFVSFVQRFGRVGRTGGILGQGFTGTTNVMLNGISANFTVISDTYIKATVPPGATTGYVTVTTPSGVLTSNVSFHVIR